MRKLVESTFVTLDGVIGDPQVWGPPYWDEQHLGYATKLVDEADALLLGRATYEVFAGSWPEREGDMADRMNALPKHVASRTLTDPTWNATVIEGDLAEAVADLKREDGRSIVKYGTGEVDRTLIPGGLVDELHLWVFPVLAGGGQRLLDGIETQHLQLVETTPFESGIVVNVYAPK
jgi:dihydrofolate reductase